MKKFFRTFMLLLAIVPCAFMFMACGKKDPEKPQEPTYDKQANVTALNNAAEKFDAAIANHTETITIELDESLIALLQSAEVEVGQIPTITLKTDRANDAYELSVPGVMDGIIAGNYNASRFADEEDGEYWNINPNTGVDVVGSILDSIDLDALQEFAFTLNNEAVTVNTVNGVEVVSIDLDLHVLINKILTTIKTNKDAPIVSLVNGLLADFGVQNTIEEIVADLKTEVTATTTVKETITLALSKFGIDVNVDALLENVKDIIELATGVSESEEALGSFDTDEDAAIWFKQFFGYGTEMIDGVAEMLEAPLFAVMEVTAEEWVEGLDMFVTTVSDEDLTLVNTMVSLIVGDPANYETQEEYLTAVTAATEEINSMFGALDAIAINDLSVIINLETENNVAKGYSIDFDVSVAATLPAGSSTISVGLTLDADFSAIGTTTIAIPTESVDFESVIVTVSAEDIESGSALEIDDVIIHSIDSFMTEEISYNNGTLTISADVIAAYLDAASNGSNMIVIFTTQDADGEDANGEELSLSIRIIVEAVEAE